jgi:hypothetical protein
VNESPSKVFARYFGQDSQLDAEDLADTLVSGPPSTFAPSTPTSEAGTESHFGMGFDFHFDGLNGSSDLRDGSLAFGSSSSFSLEDLGWPDNEIFNAGSEIDTDGEGLNEVEPSSDLDFDVGELLSWMQNNSAIHSSQDDNPTTSSSNPNGPSSTSSIPEQDDPLRALLGGCVV